MTVTIILNANAGRAGRRERPEAAEARARVVLAPLGVAVDVRATQGPGHAVTLAREAVCGGADVVVAWGGDGTVNEVAQGLVGGPGVLGIVPAGSGNGFARDLGIPRDPDAALIATLRGATRTVDAGEVNGRLFLGTTGIGFDAHVARAFAMHAGESRGAQAYVVTAVREAVRFRPAHCVVSVDGRAVAFGTTRMVAVANIRQWGNDARIAPLAAADDGLLDAVVVGDVSTWRLAIQAWRLWTGTIGLLRGVETFGGRRIVVEADRPLPWHLDGEPAGETSRLDAVVQPGVLRVRVPA